MNQPVRKEYDNKTFHPEVIDMTFGMLDPKDASEGARIIFEESWIKSYAKNHEQTQNSILEAIHSDKVHLFQKQSSSQATELFVLLNHLLSTKKPFSYKHIAYNDIEFNKPQKFITATSNFMWPKLSDITIITGTWDKLHKDHLTRFINSHLDENLTQREVDIFWYSRRNLLLSSWIDWPVNMLRWGRFEKQDWVIKVYDSSWWYGLTSNVAATEMFRNVFPNDIIESDTK